MSVTKKQSYRLIKAFLLITFSFILLTACYQPIIQKPHLTLKPSVECRVIQHKFGETCVPFKPQRIIALDPRITLDPLIALGIKPIGFASYGSKGKEVLLGVSLDEVKGSENVGNPDQASLEKILMLKPDLILKTDYNDADQSYKLESVIAPTLPVPNENRMVDMGWEKKAYFKHNLRYIAKLVGQEAKAEEVLIQHQKRIEELKKRLGNQLQQIEISVLFYGEGYIWTIGKDDIISTIFSDIGLRHKFLPDSKDWMLSIETIDEYDADILFIVDIDKRGSSFYFQNPMFTSLKSVKNNRAYVVSQENWRGFGMSGANKILDDLFKYLPQGG
jgi:iron complex transport system substrate-binding protein